MSLILPCRGPRRGLRSLLLQALSMGEIVSSLPSSGGPYFWAIHLAPKKGRSPAFAGWMTGVHLKLVHEHEEVDLFVEARDAGHDKQDLLWG